MRPGTASRALNPAPLPADRAGRPAAVTRPHGSMPGCEAASSAVHAAKGRADLSDTTTGADALLAAEAAGTPVSKAAAAAAARNTGLVFMSASGRWLCRDDE